MIGKGFVLFKINSTPTAFYIKKPICIIVIGFYARQHICYIAYILSPVRLSDGWIIEKRLKLGLWNFHHTVAPSLQKF